MSRNDYIKQCYKLVDCYFSQRDQQEDLHLLVGSRLDYIINEIKNVYDDYRKELDYHA